MMRKRPEKDTVNPPGQIVNPIPDAITEHNIREWKKYEQERNHKPPTFEELIIKYQPTKS